MNRTPQPDTSSTTPDRKRELAPGEAPPSGNPNDQVEQWEEQYFENSTDESRGDPGPNP